MRTYELSGPDADHDMDWYRMLELPERGVPYSPDEVVFMDFGACKGKNPVLFDTNTSKGRTAMRGTVTIGKKVISKSAAINAARSICESCPVIAECRAFIERYPEPEGIWAGMLPEERGQA